MRNELLRNARFHKADQATKDGAWHNKHHEQFEQRINKFKKNGGGDFGKARPIAEDAASILKVSASFTDGDGDEHLEEVKKQLNEALPKNDPANSFYIAENK